MGDVAVSEVKGWTAHVTLFVFMWFKTVELNQISL